MPFSLRLLLLSLAAGCVDAIAFVHTGVFPANMTGNSVVLALALIRIGTDGFLLPAIALAAFCLGVAAGAVIVPGKTTEWNSRVRLGIGCAAALLLAGAATTLFSIGAIPAVALAAVAMGLQSTIAQRFGVAGVATVVVTGTLTTAIARLVTRKNGEPIAATGHHLPAGSWLAYLAGAIAGGLQSFAHLGGIIFLPAVGLAVVALIPDRRR